MNSLQSRLARRWPLVAVMFATVALLGSSVRTGWVCDDALNSTLPGYWELMEIHPARETVVQIRSWYVHGRFNPLMHVWKNGWFYLVRDLAVHKALILALVGLDLWLLYRLARVLGLSREAAALGPLLFALFLQFRMYHDAVLGFNGMMQFVVALVLGSLLCLCRYRDTGRSRYLAFSLLLYLAGCLTYECCTLLFLAHGLLIGFRRAIPFAAVGVGVILTSLSIRVCTTPLPQSPYRMVLDPSVVWDTFTNQCLSALPLTYGLFDPNREFAGKSFVGAWLSHAWFGVALATLVVVLASRLKPTLKPRSWYFLALLSAGLIVLPAVPVAVCHRYQLELRPGLGHLPVYLQTLGVAMLLLTGVLALASRLSHGVISRLSLAVVLGLLCAVVASGHRASNACVVASHEAWSRLRADHEELLRAGFVDLIPEGDQVLTDPFIWVGGKHTSSFYLMNAGRRLRVYHPHKPVPEDVGWRVFLHGPPLGGKAFGLATIDRLRIAKGTSESDLTLRRIAVRTRSEGDAPMPPGDFTLRGRTEVSSRDLALVRTTKGWAIYDLPVPMKVNEAEFRVEFHAVAAGPE